MFIVDIWENKSESGTSGRIQSKHDESNWAKMGEGEKGRGKRLQQPGGQRLKKCG